MRKQFYLPLLFLSTALAAQSPVETACRIADNVLRDVRFHYNLKLADEVDNAPVQTLDFGRNFLSTGCGYALSTVTVESSRTVNLDIMSHGECKLLVNGKEVWNSSLQAPSSEIKPIEREYILSGKASLNLEAGVNMIMVKSIPGKKDDSWKVYLRPRGFNFSLEGLGKVEKSVCDVSRWLMVGPLPTECFTGGHPVEQGFETASLYRGADGEPVSWTIPRLELVASNAEIHQPWGEGYTAFNYHAGGLAMAMQRLGTYTGIEKYNAYAREYCDYYIGKRDYLRYQKYTLNAFDAWDHKVIDGYLLDYTSAPLLSFAEILLDTKPEERDPAYVALFNEMQNYLDSVQTRTSMGNFDRINPHKYTVWVDDMYMSLPFLVQSSRLATSPAEKARRIDEAANMVFAFNEFVFHPDKGLYQHAQFLDENVTMPFWSRGNGWALWAVSNILEVMPAKHPLYRKLMAHYRRHLDSLIALQDESGLWHNVLDMPSSYLETSGTAIFALCIARGVRLGWLNAKRYAPVARKAWAGIETMIDKDYMVHGITVGTNCTTDVSYYTERPTALNDCHGLFPVISAAVEMDKMERKLK